MTNFVFTQHAANRWFERFPDADFKEEMSHIKRRRDYENKYCRTKSNKARVYFTKSKIALVCKAGAKGVLSVITCVPATNFSSFDPNKGNR